MKKLLNIFAGLVSACGLFAGFKICETSPVIGYLFVIITMIAGAAIVVATIEK